jgi:hypothetical protein
VEIRISKISGTGLAKAWSYVHAFSQDDETELVVAVCLKGLSGVAALENGRKVISTFEEIYKEKVGEGYLVALRAAIAGAKDVFSQIPEPTSELGLEIASGVFVQSPQGIILYGGGIAGGQLWVRKDGQMGKILQISSNEVNVVSGRLKNGELVLLGTSGFFEVAEGRIRAALMTGGSDEVAEALAPIIEGNPLAAGAAVQILAQESVKEQVLEGAREETKADLPVVGVPQVKNKNNGTLFGGWSLPVSRKVAAPQVFVGGKDVRAEKSRKAIKIIAVFLLVVLSGSVFWGRRQRVKQETEAKYGNRVDAVVAKFNEGQNLIDINPSRARELLNEAKMEGEAVLAEGYSDPQLKEAVNKAGAVLGAASGEVNVEPGLFLDLGLLREGVAPTRMSFSIDRFHVLDPGSLRIIEVTMQKAASVIGGGAAMEGASLVGGYGERSFVLAKSGIAENSENNEGKVVVETDSEWGEINSMVSYGGNIYLLDRTGNTIWRYPGIEGGFGAKQRWLGVGVELDFSVASDMAIDGGIWVGTSTGKIIKLVLGSPETFSISGMNEPIDEIFRIDTNEESDNLYILDRQNKRIVVVSKDKGEYKKQFRWEKMGEVGDLAVNEKEGRLYLLVGSKIMVLEL